MKTAFWPTAAALSVLAVTALISLFIGRVYVPPSEIIAGLNAGDMSLASLVLTELRVPRAILAIVVGATLGLAGAVLQGLTRNPLADPGILGVSSGASLGAIISIYFGLSKMWLMFTPVLGMTGAIAAGALTFLFGRGGTLTLILAGSAVTGLFSALVSMALNFAPSPYAAYEMSMWMLGSISEKSWDHVLVAAPFVGVGVLMMALLARALDALSLGEAQAASMGVNLDRTRVIALIGVGLSVGACTSVTGSIGFIGLVAPHLIRPFVGHQPSRILLPSAILGATLLLVADVLTRIVPTNQELRLGVITSLIGAPFFFWLVVRLRRTSP